MVVERDPVLDVQCCLPSGLVAWSIRRCSGLVWLVPGLAVDLDHPPQEIGISATLLFLLLTPLSRRLLLSLSRSLSHQPPLVNRPKKKKDDGICFVTSFCLSLFAAPVLLSSFSSRHSLLLRPIRPSCPILSKLSLASTNGPPPGSPVASSPRPLKAPSFVDLEGFF